MGAIAADILRDKVLLLDVDGVLTDNSVYVDETGARTLKKFHARDGRALRRFALEGWEIHVVTASDWPGAIPYLARFPVAVHVDHAKTAEALAEVVRGRAYVACGDDHFDLEMLRGASLAYCPSDADAAVLLLPGICYLQTPGGRGCLSEMARRILDV